MSNQGVKESKNKILLVEDEESLATGLEFNLQQEGYDVIWARDGRQALDCIKQQEFDLIVLDVMLPYHNGFEIAEHIRKRTPQQPVLMLTARTAANDRVRGLEIGVDDYVTKPFHLEELLLRIQNMLKRKNWYKSVSDMQPIYEFGSNIINFQNLTAKTGDCEIQLTQREAMVLKYLIEHTDTIVSRKELLAHVWQIHSDIETRTVDNFIVRLRKHFETDPAKPQFIKSVRSVGYIFTTDEPIEQKTDKSTSDVE